jgi:hypothetical protein
LSPVPAARIIPGSSRKGAKNAKNAKGEEQRANAGSLTLLTDNCYAIPVTGTVRRHNLGRKNFLKQPTA